MVDDIYAILNIASPNVELLHLDNLHLYDTVTPQSPPASTAAPSGNER